MKKKDWIQDLDFEEKIKLRKVNRRKTVEDNPPKHKKGLKED